jgi:hypothetical protein
MRRRRFIILSFLNFYIAAMLMAACETDSYEKGEGKYSLMQADMAELSVNGQKRAIGFVTDDGDSYQLTNPYAAKWIQTADTTYRTIIYYNKVESGQAEMKAVSTVVTLWPIAHWRFKEQSQDPVGFESAWLAKNRRYLNVGLLMKTGRIDDEELPHNVGLAQDTIITHTNGHRTAYYRLLHSQNGIPQYYTNRRYVSILLPQPLPDTITLSLQTFDGTVRRTFVP